MDENEVDKDWRRSITRRLEILEAAVFASPAGDLPIDLHDEKEKKPKKIKESKILGYIANNDVSKTELSLLAQLLGLQVSSIYSKEEMKEAILDKKDKEDPVEHIRAKTATFILENNVALSTVKCDLKCSSCPESRVALCQLYNQKQIDNHFEQ